MVNKGSTLLVLRYCSFLGLSGNRVPQFHGLYKLPLGWWLPVHRLSGVHVDTSIVRWGKKVCKLGWVLLGLLLGWYIYTYICVLDFHSGLITTYCQSPNLRIFMGGVNHLKYGWCMTLLYKLRTMFLGRQYVEWTTRIPLFIIGLPKFGKSKSCQEYIWWFPM